MSGLIGDRVFPCVLADAVGDLLHDLLAPGGRCEQRVITGIREESRLDQYCRHSRVECHIEMALNDAVILRAVGGKVRFDDPSKGDVVGLGDVARRSVGTRVDVRVGMNAYEDPRSGVVGEVDACLKLVACAVVRGVDVDVADRA